jgi:hypothetical protein
MAQGSNQPMMASSTTASVSGTTTTANVAIAGNGESCLVYNPGTTIAFVNFGTDNTVAATVTGFPIPPGGSRLIGISNLVKYAAAIMGTGTATIYFTRGNGSTY